MSSTAGILWTFMVFTGATTADLLASRGFPVYLTAVATGIGAGLLVVELSCRCCRDDDEEEDGAAAYLPRQRDGGNDAS